MKLYGHPYSTCTRKVLATLHEKQARAEFVTIDITTGAHKKPEFLALQPFGKVPAFEDDDGFRFYESRAIMRYLDEKLPGPALTPRDAKGRALMEQWISVEMSNFTPHAMAIVMEDFFKPMGGGQPDAARVARAREALAEPLRVMEAQLGATPFIAGNALTLADLCFAPYLEYLGATSAKDLVPGYPRVAAWWQTVRARPSWQHAIGKGA